MLKLLVFILVCAFSYNVHALKPKCIMNGSCKKCELRPKCLCAATCTPNDFLWTYPDTSNLQCTIQLLNDTYRTRSTSQKLTLLLYGASSLERLSGFSKCKPLNQPGYKGSDMLHVWNKYRQMFCLAKIHSISGETTHQLMHRMLIGDNPIGIMTSNRSTIIFHLSLIGNDVQSGSTQQESASRAIQIIIYLAASSRLQSKIVILAAFPRCNLDLSISNMMIKTWANNVTAVRSRGPLNLQGIVQFLDCNNLLLTYNGRINKELVPDCTHPSAIGWQHIWERCILPSGLLSTPTSCEL